MKKAQSQIHESIIVIFIFSIIFAMALFGVYRYNTLSVQGIQKDIEESRSLSLLNNLPGSPLIQQSELGNEKEAVDTLKILDLELNGLGFRTIEITHTYPSCNSYIIYNRVRQTGNKNVVSIPVSVYFPLTKEVKVGKLTITTYE